MSHRCPGVSGSEPRRGLSREADPSCKEADRVYDIAVLGMGYVGLPLALEATESGMRAVGLDIDRMLVESLNAGTSHIVDVADEEIQDAVAAGFEITTDWAVLGDAAAIVIAVPTPLVDYSPDLAFVEAAATTVGNYLRANQLVVLESTTYPGTTEEIVQPILEERSGLSAGTDFHLAFSPERIDPGNPTWNLRNTPKLVAGIDALSTERAAELYGTICDEVVTVSGTREAEMAKLLENTYRHVNIALVNEMAILCRELDIDIWEVIDAAATKPFGYQAFYPGPGVGGHCIPVDPNYLSFLVRRLGFQFRFVELAQEINDRMPRYVVDRVAALLNEQEKAVNGSRVLLIGITYKPDVADPRESPALQVAALLAERGAVLSYADPFADRLADDMVPMIHVHDAVEAAAVCDVAVILTPHTAFDIQGIVSAAPAVLDTRGVVSGNGATRL